MYASPFYGYFYKGRQLLWFIVCLPGRIDPSKMGLLLKKRICSWRSKFFSLRFDPFLEGKQKWKRQSIFPWKRTHAIKTVFANTIMNAHLIFWSRESEAYYHGWKKEFCLMNEIIKTSVYVYETAAFFCFVDLSSELFFLRRIAVIIWKQWEQMSKTKLKQIFF